MPTDTKRIKGRRKPSGWKGDWGDLFWTKESVYGLKYKCQSCDHEQLGTYGNKHKRMHRADCPVMAQPVTREDLTIITRDE